MRTSYVVDGYNLLFHLGLFDRRGGAHALEAARERLLDYLKPAFCDSDATVIFDSARSTRSDPSAENHQGLHVQYAGRGQEADDVIEELIAHSASPQNLVVISNDHRLQVAARRKGAQSWSCDEFLDFKNARPQSPSEPVEADRAAPPSRAEVQHWLQEFGDLAGDPAFRELFERFPFEDVEEEPADD
jgi:predicted RNA-binding protein with PIN domain